MHVFYGEMSMRLLRRYAGGLACLVTALALVACGGGPGSSPEPKQIGNIAFQQGEKVRTIPLSDKFNGANLTYSATTSSSSVATVTVDQVADTLTVTAVGPGTATITVTAKNSGGEAKQTFTVTVPKPPAPAPAPVEIPDIPSLAEGATSSAIPLGDKFSGENLTYDASSSNERVATVSVNNTADTLTVTAVGPGTATITVTATAQGSATQTKTFTVTVPQPTPVPQAPTVRTGARASVDVNRGATETITLSTVFDGALTYDVSSSAATVADASESGGTLTITGVSVGSATITIVATNDAGRAEHEITVTVTAPAPTTPTPTPTNNPSSCKSPLTIQRDDHEHCTLPDDHSLVYSKPDREKERLKIHGPDSSETSNVWTITALRKGRPVVQIRDDDTGNTVGEITVVVPNSPPRLVDEDGVLGTTDPPTPIPLTVATEATKIGFHTATLTAINTAFTDEDEVDKNTDTDEGPVGNGIFNYKVQHKPDELLIKTVRGFLLEKNSATADAAVTIDAVVLKPFTEDFSIEVYAYDLDNAQSDHPITVNFSASASTPVNPVGGTYAVTQKENGDFEPVRVGNRLSIPGTNTVVEHTLEFVNAAGDADAPFKFASNLNETLTTEIGGKAYLGTPSPDLTTVALCGGNTVPDKESTGMEDVGDACYTYTATNRVEIPAHDDFTHGAAPEIDFILPSKTNGLTSGSATITIKYHVHAYSARQTHPVDANLDPQPSSRIHSATESLRIDIHKCVVTSDCPIE